MVGVGALLRDYDNTIIWLNVRHISTMCALYSRTPFIAGTTADLSEHVIVIPWLQGFIVENHPEPEGVVFER